jgi:uncharacterized membrane protein YhiD involved in acid resistance
MTRDRLRFHGLAAAWLLLTIACGVLALADTSDGSNAAGTIGLFGGDEATTTGMQAELRTAAVRLPIAAALGALLALRPKRGGTPPRKPAVVQTQIILAIVGAIIMLVVGASLARAFGIVGVASLIRYRSKIEDPKDAVVMLGALAVGLAAGCGVLALAGFATAFTVVVLWVIEGFEPRTRMFELTVKLGEKTGQLRPRVEAILRRVKARFELRGSSEVEVSYLVTTPQGLQTDLVSDKLTALAPEGKGGIEWKEKSKAKP